MRTYDQTDGYLQVFSIVFLFYLIKGETFWGCFAQSPNIYSYILMIFPYHKLGFMWGCFQKCGCPKISGLQWNIRKKHGWFRGTLHDLGNLHIPILRWAMGFVNWLVNVSSWESDDLQTISPAGPAWACWLLPSSPRAAAASAERNDDARARRAACGATRKARPALPRGYHLGESWIIATILLGFGYVVLPFKLFLYNYCELCAHSVTLRERERSHTTGYNCHG